jgi:hypothetical protein
MDPIILFLYAAGAFCTMCLIALVDAHDKDPDKEFSWWQIGAIVLWPAVMVVALVYMFLPTQKE